MPEMDLRQIDALVAEKVMEWNVQTADSVREVYVWPNTLHTTYVNKGERFVVHQDGTALTVPPYSSDIAAAWQVVEKMRADGWLPSLEYERGEWVCHMGHFAYDAGYAVNVSAPLAVCLAALDAVGVEVPEDA